MTEDRKISSMIKAIGHLGGLMTDEYGAVVE
jgi:hypothetical protein